MVSISDVARFTDRQRDSGSWGSLNEQVQDPLGHHIGLVGVMVHLKGMEYAEE